MIEETEEELEAYIALVINNLKVSLGRMPTYAEFMDHIRKYHKDLLDYGEGLDS